MQKKWVFELEVDEEWIADGFDPKADDIKDLLLNYWLTNAHCSEVKVKSLKSPHPEYIRRLQREGPKTQ